MPLVEVCLPALALVVAVRNPRVPELHTLLAKLGITYRWWLGITYLSLT